MNRVIVPLLLILAGCAAPVLAPSEMKVTEINYGLARVRNDEPEYTQRTSQVPCDATTMFGATVRIAFPRNTRRIPISAEWRQPAIPGVRGEIETFISGPLSVPRRATNFNLDAFFDFDSPAEVVAGEYKLRIFDASTSYEFYSHSFQVGGCE